VTVQTAATGAEASKTQAAKGTNQGEKLVQQSRIGEVKKDKKNPKTREERGSGTLEGGKGTTKKRTE